jgi:hypothetical protein
MSDNQSQPTKAKASITPKMIGLGCLGLAIVGLAGIAGIFGIVMLSISASPYKISCRGDGGVSSSGFIDQQSADAAVREKTAQGMTCTKDYSQAKGNQAKGNQAKGNQAKGNQAKGNQAKGTQPEAAQGNDTGPQLDRSQVEATLSNELTEKNQLQVKSIQCPEAMLATTNTSYDCETRVSSADGQNLMKTILTITPTGSDGTFDYKTSQIFLLGSTIESSIVDVVKAELPQASPVVKCPAEMLAKVGQTYKCSLAIDNDQTGDVIIQPTTDGGSYDREIKMHS